MSGRSSHRVAPEPPAPALPPIALRTPEPPASPLPPIAPRTLAAQHLGTSESQSPIAVNSERYRDEHIEGGPTAPVDFVLKFVFADVKDLELTRQRTEMINAIKFSGLTAVRRVSSRKDRDGNPAAWYIFVSCSEEMMVLEATRIQLRKKMRAELKDAESGVSGYENFDEAHRDLFEPFSETEYFTSLERQRCIYSKLEAPLVEQGAALDLDGAKASGLVSDFSFISVDAEEAPLHTSWIHNYFAAAPVHAVRAYLGEKPSFYFAFFDHYITALMPLSIFSIGTFSYQMAQSVQAGFWVTDNLMVPIYAIVICVWSTIMLETWKRKQSTLAFQWGTQFFEEHEPSRPEYLTHPLTEARVGEFKDSIFVPHFPDVQGLLGGKAGGEGAEEGETEHVFPEGVQLRRVLASLAFTLTLIAAVAIGALFTMVYKIVLRNTYGQYGNYLGSAINVFFISLIDLVWAKLALILNDWEMYRTDSQWFNALVYKTFLFRFLNKNITPFYIAFVQGLELELFGYGVRDSCPNEDCLRALSDYLLVAVVISEVSRNLITLIPIFLDWLKAQMLLRKRAQAAAEAAKQGGELDTEAVAVAVAPPSAADLLLEAVEAELLRTEYPGTFNEMLELSIQLGYVTMFAVGFPIAPFFVLLANMVERKTDALKTLHMRRPRYRGATGIGSWQSVLEFLVAFSVVTNMLILFFSSKWLRDFLAATLPARYVLLVVVIVEHLLFLLKLGISVYLPDTPAWVFRAQARQALTMKGTSESAIHEKTLELRARIQQMRSTSIAMPDERDKLLA